ncbi:MAG: IS4 family transposase [Methyloceanibacter sp.]
MPHQDTVFGQLLKLVPRHEFDRLAATHHAGAKLRRLTRWSQFVAMATAHLARRFSLRDVVANLKAQAARLYHLGARPVARSSLARVNEEQPWQFYEALFGVLYGRCQAHAPRHGFRFKNKLYSLDASLIDLSLKVFPWAHYALGKAAMKLHLGLDHDGHLPAFATVSESRVGDTTVARSVRLPRGSIAVFDKGFSDYAWLKSLDESGIFFVTRARANIDATVVERYAGSHHDTIDFDHAIVLDGKRPRAMNMPRLRTVGFTCPDTGRRYVFLTNIFHLTADVIADIYKQRWQIELFFKWLKQNLKLRGFLGTSRNAVLTQIWIALCLALLLAYLKFLGRIGLSLQTILRLLQLNLFLRRDLLALLKDEPPDRAPDPRQCALAL